MVTPVGGGLLRDLADLARRVRALERPQREVLTPARLADAALVTVTSPTAIHVAVSTGTGTAITWTVLVQADPGTTLSLRVRDSTGAVSETASGTDAATLRAQMSLQGWQTGEERLVYLDAWVDTGSATVLVVRAIAG